MKILVIAPHPDDEVLGCGGTIIKHAELGDEVYLCIATEAYTPDWSEEFLEKREEEIKSAVEFMGTKETILLHLPTVKLDTINQKIINDKISNVVAQVNPEVVYIPFYGDINKDHKIISEATLVALRPKPGISLKKVFCYETLSETEWAKPPQKIEEVFVPNFYEDISDYLTKKIKAMECYGSEVKEYPHPRSLKGIEILAQKRGTEAGLKAAEAFMLVREIKK